MTGTEGSGTQGPSNLPRIGRVALRSGSQRRVCSTTASPASTAARWRAISKAMASPTCRTEFIFLTSTLVFNPVAPRGRIEILASTRMVPLSMLQSEAPT
jgi:hypothetical protein